MEKNSLSASHYLDIEKAKPSYGKMREKLEIIAELPPVGSIVELYETVYRERNIMRDGQLLRNYKVPVSDGISEFGNIRKFKVEKYTKGIEFPLDSSNHMILRHFNSINGEVGWKTSVPVRQISVGAVAVKVVSEGESKT